MKISYWIIAKMMTSKFSYNRFFVGFFLLFETKSQRTTRSLRNKNCKFFTKWMVERKVNIFCANFRNQRRNNVNFIAKNLINNFAAETGRSVGRRLQQVADVAGKTFWGRVTSFTIQNSIFWNQQSRKSIQWFL